MSPFCLANVFLLYFHVQLWICIRRAIVYHIQDGVLVKIYGEMSSFCAATSGGFRSIVLESESSST